jgi:tetratricopeptide (TPR) repeat protein
MNRENTLFAVVGLLLGYAAAFTLVVYLNQGAPPAAASAPQGAQASSSEQSTVSVREQQRLQSDAAQSAQKARAEPDNFEAQQAAANASVSAGDYEGAIDFLTRANKIKPDDYETLLMLGRANFEAQRFDVAGSWYALALKRKPEDLDARSELALTYFLRTPPDVERAVSEFNAALARDPAHEMTLHNMTLVFIQTGRLKEAEATLARLEKASPGNDKLPVLRERLKEAQGSGGRPAGQTSSGGGSPAPPAGAAGAQKKTPTD